MVTTEARCSKCSARNRVPDDASGRPRCGKCSADLPWLVDATGATFDEIVATSSLPILVDLWAPWCGPCQIVAPILEQLSIEFAGSLRVVKVNVDESPTVSARLSVQGIPTMVLFNAGGEISRQVGALPGDQIRTWVERSLRAAGVSPSPD